MDTNVLPNETNELHIELSEAARKVAKRDDRAEANVGFGATTEGMAITKSYIDTVTAKVIEKLDVQRSRSNTVEAKLERLLRQLPAEVLALCLLQSGLHAAGRWGKNTLTDTEASMGAAINDELWAAKLLLTDRKRALKITKAACERYSSVELRKAYVKREAAKPVNGVKEDGSDSRDGFEMQDWNTKMRITAGHWGTELLLEAMPLVFEKRGPSQFKGEYLWAVTEFGMDIAKQALSEVVCLSPVYQPRTEPPKDWDRFTMRVAEDDRTLDRAQLLRTHHKDVMSAAGHAIRTGKMAPALKALNTMQSVPFMINTWIMDVMVGCYNDNISVEGLPSYRRLSVPKKLPMDQWADMTVEQRKLHSRTRKGRQKANRANDADVILFTEDIEIAKRLAVVDRFYTPMNWDWRTRTYSLTHFNFQREDRVRALFLFANGEPLGDDGLYWLKLHVANSGDFDKVSKKTMEERIKWVDDNMELITDYTKRPLYSTGWTKADNPFLFLAACRELVSAVSVGSSYVCHLPVSWDGACNGLQHLAAMTRAPEGRYVNLTSDPVPHDVYNLIADLTKELIEADKGSTEKFGKTETTIGKLAALALSYGIDRKLVKRNVMTFTYSSKEFGMGEQQYEDTMEPLELKWLKGEIDEHPFGETEEEWRTASRYLAKRVLQSIKNVVKLPAEAMAFMQALARALAHESKPLRWITPAGVPCINRYHDMIIERVTLWCNDGGVKTRTYRHVAVGFEQPIAKDKAAAGIAPNFVHSHDAAHLLLTVAACVDEGITDIATVHDSFGCLPSRAGRFNQIIRETLLRMYTDHDVLAELLESARADLTPANHERLPELPAKGALDLEEVINARYAFA